MDQQHHLISAKLSGVTTANANDDGVNCFRRNKKRYPQKIPQMAIIRAVLIQEVVLVPFIDQLD